MGCGTGTSWRLAYRCDKGEKFIHFAFNCRDNFRGLPPPPPTHTHTYPTLMFPQNTVSFFMSPNRLTLTLILVLTNAHHLTESTRKISLWKKYNHTYINKNWLSEWVKFSLKGPHSHILALYFAQNFTSSTFCSKLLAVHFAQNLFISRSGPGSMYTKCLPTGLSMYLFF